jgi:hypothetical protein
VWRSKVAFAAHLHDAWARGRCQTMNQCRLRNRTREMWDKTNVVRFADCCQLHEFGNAA